MGEGNCPGPPGLWTLRKFSRVAVSPLYRALHARDRGRPRHLPGHQTLCRFFVLFSRTGAGGPLPCVSAQGRAPPGGQGWWVAWVVRLELWTLSFFPLFPPPSHRGHCQAAVPASERHQAATVGTAAPWPAWSSGLCNFFQLFPPPSHRGHCQAAVPASERHQAATVGTAAPWPAWSSALCNFFKTFFTTFHHFFHHQPQGP